MSVYCSFLNHLFNRYPAYTPVLLSAIELWYHDPSVTTPVLKLMAELVQNRSQRLQFDVSSPNGILLFRETSKMMVAYGESRELGTPCQLKTLSNIVKAQFKLLNCDVCDV